MQRRIAILIAGVCLAVVAVVLYRRTQPRDVAPPPPVASGDSTPAGGDTSQSLSDSALAAITQPRTGDFDSMLARRQVRVIVVPSRTQYFVDRGTPRGIAVDAAALFEAYLNKKYRTGAQAIHVVLVPVRHDEVVPALLAGRGDIAAAGLTVTPEGLKEVDFSTPILSNVSEIVVTGPASPPLRAIDDLAGKEIFVRRSSAYWENLQALNADFHRRGLAPIRLRAAPEALQDEDRLEMLSSGLVPLLVMNDYLVNFWKQVLPGITPRPDLPIKQGAEIAWMLRKHSPRLKAEVDAFLAKYPEGSATRNMLLQKYLQSTKFVEDAVSPAELLKFQQTVALFKKYGSKYDLDFLLMMAQGYQESRLDQSAKSQVGAVGIMQVMPATGRALGVGDIHQIEPNVHAGVKYVRSLIDTNFSDDSLDALNRTLFAFAAYNAGPARIAGLRRRAAARGLDPNQWQNNVEVIAGEEIGQETVTYVANIFKYYVAYTLVMEQAAEREAAMKAP
jgi:membrane-bound lytic murein transglycosylase MltF